VNPLFLSSEVTINGWGPLLSNGEGCKRAPRRPGSRPEGSPPSVELDEANEASIRCRAAPRRWRRSPRLTGRSRGSNVRLPAADETEDDVDQEDRANRPADVGRDMKPAAIGPDGRTPMAVRSATAWESALRRSHEDADPLGIMRHRSPLMSLPTMIIAGLRQAAHGRAAVNPVMPMRTPGLAKRSRAPRRQATRPWPGRS